MSSRYHGFWPTVSSTSPAIVLVSAAHSWPSRLIGSTLCSGSIARPVTKVVNSISFASPPLVYPQRLGDGRGQRGTSLLPCVSCINSKDILCRAYRHHRVLYLLKSEDVSDRVNSVYRDRRLGSSRILHLAVPLLPLRQLASHLFLARDMLEYLPRCNFHYVFLFAHQLCRNRRFLLLNLLPTSSSIVGIIDRFLKDSELF